MFYRYKHAIINMQLWLTILITILMALVFFIINVIISVYFSNACFFIPGISKEQYHKAVDNGEDIDWKCQPN